MAKKFNSASRAYEVLHKAASQNPNGIYVDVWFDAFGMLRVPDGEHYYEVIESIRFLRDEIANIRNFMEATSLENDLYDAPLQNISHILDVKRLTEPWKSSRVLLTDKNLHTLKWCSEHMPDEKDQLSQKDLKDLNDQAVKLEKILQGGKLPHSMKSLIEKHIEIIKKAIRSYDLIGIKSFRNAIYESHADFSERDTVDAEDLKSDEAKKGVKLLFNLLGKVKSIPGVIVDVDRVLGAGIGIADNAKKIYELYKSTSPPGE